MASPLLKRINALDRKLDKVQEIEEHLDKLVAKEEKEVARIEKEERAVERHLLKIGNFTIKKSHFLELSRGTAGAFLGVGIGQALGSSVSLAKTLPWLNTVGILVFIFILVGLLIYKKDKDIIDQSHTSATNYLTRKLLQLYLISVVVEILGLILFNNFPGWNEILFKSLIIGSYAAMSSAVAFTLV